MAITTTEFRAELRLLLQDPLGSSAIFSENDLDRFRNQALRDLYKPGVRCWKEDSNYSGTHTAMPLAVSTTLDYALPANMFRILGVEYWTNEANTLYVATSAMWSDRERSGYVRIYDGPSFVNYRIMIFGAKKWTGIDDSSMPDEVIDVVMLGSALRAVKAFANKRAASRRAAAGARQSDTSLGAETLWYRQTLQDWKVAVKDARKALRPVGR